MPSNDRPFWVWIVFPAVTMSLGWGLRGYIGGSSLGAMIPGAMVALVLALLLGRLGAAAGVLAALGAVGVGFGGQETYGQTVGLSLQPETMAWALLGFAVKGGMWGLLGGAFIGFGLLRGSKAPVRDLWTGVLLMILATWCGWLLIDHPKLMYFSNRVDKPREEVWAGLVAGGLALLGWLWWRGIAALPWRFAFWGAVSGAAGFSLGAWFQVIGRAHYPALWIDWWKVMEFTFGALLGAGLGFAGYRSRDLPSLGQEEARDVWPAWLLLVVAAGVSLAVIGADEHLPVRMGYTIAGGGAILAAWRWPRLAWQIAISLTCFAFLLDLIEARPLLGEGSWLVAAIGGLAIAAWLTRNEDVLPALLMLTWASTGVSVLKTYLPPGRWNATAHAMEAAFVVLAGVTTMLARATAKRA